MKKLVSYCFINLLIIMFINNGLLAVLTALSIQVLLFIYLSYNQEPDVNHKPDIIPDDIHSEYSTILSGTEIERDEELKIHPSLINKKLFIPESYDENFLIHEIGHLKYFNSKLNFLKLYFLNIYGFTIIPTVINTIIIVTLGWNIFVLMITTIIATVIVCFILLLLNAYYMRSLEYKADLFAAEQVGFKSYAESLKINEFELRKLEDDENYIVNLLFYYLKTHPHPDTRKERIMNEQLNL